MANIQDAKEKLKGKVQESRELTVSPKVATMKGLKTADVKGLLSLYKAQIAQALPKHLSADRIIQLATTLITRTPALAECSTPSLIGAVMQASILGFEPVISLGQCYLLPYANNKTGFKEVQFIIGYRGMIELARRSGQLKDIYAQAVYTGDEFKYEFGLEPKLVHIPALENRGNLTHVYAVAHFTNGGFAFEVMSKYDVDKIRSKSPAKNAGAWVDFYDEMAKKTVIRRLWKLLPSSVETRVAETTDEKILQPDIFEEGEIDLNKVDEADYNVESAHTDEKKEQETEKELFEDKK